MRRPIFLAAIAAVAIVIAGALSGAMAVASYVSPEGSDSSPWASQHAYRLGYEPQTIAVRPVGLSGDRATYAALIATEAHRQGVDPVVALKIAKLESGFRPRAVNRKTGASGLLQLMPRSAEALEPGSSRNLLDPSVNARVGVKHMVRCQQAGARTGDEIARCHVAGWRGWNRRLARWAERYKVSYVAQFRGQRVDVDRGWLARGSGSLNVAMLTTGAFQ